MLIRPAVSSDKPAIWAVIEPVIRAGETYTLNRDLTECEALTYWFGPDKQTFVADDHGRILGTYYLRPNQSGGGSHVCNCGYMTNPAAMGRGVAKAMCLHSIATAKSEGFQAMQFNFVVSVNDRAVRLWQSLGFEIVGRLPKAFMHPIVGAVDAFVMHREI